MDTIDIPVAINTKMFNLVTYAHKTCNMPTSCEGLACETDYTYHREPLPSASSYHIGILIPYTF